MFNGVGQLRNFQVRLHIDKNIKPSEHKAIGVYRSAYARKWKKS